MNPARIVLTAALAGGALVLSAGGASAAAPDPASAAFGHHVSECAKTMGFSGAENPGVMHQGKSGWEPGMTCTMPA